MSESGADPSGAAPLARRPRSATWHCPNPSEFSLLVVTQHLDVVVQLCGELDLEALASLEECLEVAVDDAPRRLVLDLSALSFLDAAGVAALVRARTHAEDAGVAFVLDSPTPPVARVLDLVAADANFTVR